MTLEELLAAWNAAKESLTAKPEDKALQKAEAEAKKAYEDAKAAAEADDEPGAQDGGEGDPDKVDESNLDEKTKKYIAKLRKESASHRTKNKDLASKFKTEQERVKAILKAAGIESEDEKPEEKLKTVSSQNSNLVFRNAILETAVQQGVPGDQIDYFEFLVTKKTNELEDGETLPDEELAKIVAQVKKGSGKGSANSSINGGGNPPPPGDDKDKITLEKFCGMSIVEKSKLYEKNAALYEELMKAARSKKKLV